jgi:hypothetical protein
MAFRDAACEPPGYGRYRGYKRDHEWQACYRRVLMKVSHAEAVAL